MLTTSASANPVHSARDRVLNAATELFATHGFQAIGLRDLASHLGLHAGSLYHHIENKQSLLFELMESALSDLLFDTKRLIKGARSPGKRLQLFIQAFAAFNLKEKYKLTLLTREFSNLDEEQKLHIDQLKNRYSTLLRTLIVDQYGDVAIRSDDICVSTNAIIVILFGQSQWYSAETTEQRLTAMLTHVITGIIEYNKNTPLHSHNR